MKIAYANATEREIRAFAAIQNIPHDGRATENTIRAKIESVLGQLTEIEIPDEEPAVQIGGGAPALHINADPDDVDRGRVKINIMPDTEDESHVPVAVNGRSIQIPRGRDVIVPHHVYEALNNARQDVYQETGSNYIGTADQGPGLGAPRAQHSYPFSVLGFFPPAAAV